MYEIQTAHMLIRNGENHHFLFLFEPAIVVSKSVAFQSLLEAVGDAASFLGNFFAAVASRVCTDAAFRLRF